MKATFFVVGALFELVGILAIAAPDLLPWGARFAAWVRPIENRLRRILRLPPRRVFIDAAVAGGVGLSGSAMGEVTVSEHATLEEKVAFLLRRDREEQEAINRLAQRISEVEREAKERIGELREEMKGHVATELAAADERYRPLRVLGAFALAIGLGLTTAGNFL